MKKIYIEIPKQKCFIIKVDIIQIFIKTFQEIDTGWRSINYFYKDWFCLRKQNIKKICLQYLP